MLADMLKLRVSQEALAEKLALVARAVSTRTAVLVLGGIRLQVESGQLELAATDMELSLRTSLEADVDGEGEVVVPGRLLLDIVRSLPRREVTIEQRSDESVLADRSRLGELPAAHVLVGGLPAAARGRRRRSSTRSTARRCSRRSAASAARPRATRAGRCSPASSSSSSRASS